MTHEKDYELMRRYNLAGLSLSQAELEIRAIKQADAMRNAAYADSSQMERAKNSFSLRGTEASDSDDAADDLRTIFAWLPVERWSARYYRNRFYWLRTVKQRWIDGEWKALEADNTA